MRLCSAGDRMVLRSPGGDTGLGELVEPNGRRVVAFLTDGVGGGWHDGRMAGQLHRLAGYGPVVVVHLLPRHLWPRTGINPLPVYFRPDPDGGGSVRGAGGTHGFRPASTGRSKSCVPAGSRRTAATRGPCPWCRWRRPR